MAVDPSSKSIDPENPQSWNRYAYVMNNPMRYNDPDGKKWKDKATEDLANAALKDPTLSRKERKRIEKAAKSEAVIGAKQSDKARIEITPKGSTDDRPSVGSVTEIKGQIKTEEAKGSTVKATDGSITPEVDSTGKVTSADITIYGGNYSFSENGSESQRTEEQFSHHVLAAELCHVEDDKVHSEKECGHAD